MDSPAINILFTSDFYQIRNYQCNCRECHTSGVEFNNTFNLCFVRSGYFEYQVFRRNLEVHVGRVLISKPGFEHITHHIDNQPDVCSVFDFTTAFFESLKEHYKREADWFFQNRDLHSILVACNPEVDYLHHLILQRTLAANTDSMLIDEWVIQLIERLLLTLGNQNEIAPISADLKRYHLTTVEKAKEYLIANFSQQVTLQKLAEHCCVSLFYFCRIFKSIMKITPYQYLTELRLHHARLTLQNSHLPVTEVAFQCGFNSLENFNTAYKKRFNVTASSLRKVNS